MSDDLNALAARWRVDPRDIASDDTPYREPMRQAIKPMQRRAPTAEQKRERRAISRGEIRATASYSREDFGTAVRAEYERVQALNSGAGSEPGAGSGNTATRQAAAVHPLDKVGYDWNGGEHAGWAPCDNCGDGWNHHPAQYSHEGQYGEGPIFGSTCEADGMTSYFTRAGVSKDREVPKKNKVGNPSTIGPFLAPESRARSKRLNLEFREATRSESNIATSTGQILIQPGAMIRTPTGQVINVKNVRRHETSRDHYYLDTDAGTSLLPYSTSLNMVTRDDQQQNQVGPGLQGGNFGDQRQNTGQVAQPGPPSNTNASACPACGGKGTLTRRGGKMQCTRCGHTQNPQGGNLNFSDATQQYVSQLKNPRSAMVRRIEAVLAVPTATTPKESL